MMPRPAIKRHVLPWVDATNIIEPTCIVLHWWGEPINTKGIDHLVSLLRSRELSVQFAVLSNGDTYQLSPAPNTFCHHAKCANHSSIGIELEGQNEHDLDSNQLQFEAVVSLVIWLAEKYHIEHEFRVSGEKEDVRFYGITSHKQVDTHCPNANGKVDVHDSYLERVLKAL